MTDLRPAVIAMLDTEGVHPGWGWDAAVDTFWALVRNNTFEEAVMGTLDSLNISDHSLRVTALSRFYEALHESDRPSGLPGKLRGGGKKLFGGLKTLFTTRPDHGEE